MDCQESGVTLSEDRNTTICAGGSGQARQCCGRREHEMNREQLVRVQNRPRPRHNKPTTSRLVRRPRKSASVGGGEC